MKKILLSITVFISFSLVSMDLNKNNNLPYKVKVDHFVPDDVLDPSQWKKAEPIDFRDFTSTAWTRNRFVYNPEDLNLATNPIHTFVVVHGSWDYGNMSYWNENNTNFRNIKRFATWYALSSHRALELLSMRWTGDLKDRVRQSDAEILKNYLQKVEPYKSSLLTFITHSHGGNVVNYLTNIIENRTVENLFYFACPHRPEDKYKPRNFKNLIYFHIDGEGILKFINRDWITMGGRADGDRGQTIAGLTTQALMCISGSHWLAKNGYPILIKYKLGNPIIALGLSLLTGGAGLFKAFNGSNNFELQDGRIVVLMFTFLICISAVNYTVLSFKQLNFCRIL